MRPRVIPGSFTLAWAGFGTAATLAALVAGFRLSTVAVAAGLGALVLLVLALVDYAITRKSWRASAVRMVRR